MTKLIFLRKFGLLKTTKEFRVNCVIENKNPENLTSYASNCFFDSLSIIDCLHKSKKKEHW
jgi:hypothetical protein